MEGAYLNNISFKDLILQYLIEEIIKEQKEYHLTIECLIFLIICSHVTQLGF